MDVEYTVLDYEIMMFVQAVIIERRKILIQATNSKLFLYAKNVFAESRVLHIRVLTEVFLSGGRKDDIKARDLMSSWCAKNKNLIQDLETAYQTELSDLGKSPKYLIDKHLAHATTERGTSFNWEPVIRKMEEPIKNILKALPVEKFPSVNLISKI